MKSKLPKTLSYPLGAEAISDGLANALHLADFSLRFFDAPVWPASAFQRLLRESLPYKIFVASYRPAFESNYLGANYLAEEGSYNQKWELQAYPVLRELRQQAGQLLIQEGFPAVVEWLSLSNQIGWDSRQHNLALVFNPSEGTLVPQREDGV